jgi:GT2 family glycosyltransferase
MDDAETGSPREAAQDGTPGTSPVPCPWEHFNADWYAATYMHRLAPGDPSEPFAHYTRLGTRRGASPNPYFDEVWYLNRYPEVREGMRRGSFASGFAHYCTIGYRDHDPHWLFREQFYRARRGDLNSETLARHAMRNGYHHYLAAGQNEPISGSYFFDPAMLASATGLANTPFSALLTAPWLGNLRLSAYFDPDWYLAMHDEVEDLIAEGKYSSALHHYMTNPEPLRFAGSADFDEGFYARRYPNIAEAIQAGLQRCGYPHFINHGRFENRQPSPWFDPNAYGENAVVARALAEDPELTAFDHYLRYGKRIGLPAARAPHRVKQAERPGQECAGKDIFARFAHLWASNSATAPLALPQPEAPDISVVICAFNHFDLTMQTLLMLSGSIGVSFETILIDNGSLDATRQIENRVHGLRLIRNDSNLGFLLASNQGIAAARGRYVLLLNNDVVLPPNALRQALRRMDADKAIGALGGKVVRTHGQLQEAGCILFRDGSALGYGRDADPFEPEFDVPRDVDFVSGLFLMVRRPLLMQLGGFDGDFSPAYYEDTDLCVRIWKSGHRVVYDPTVVIVHLEYGSSRNPDGPRALMRRNQDIFLAKHRDWLASKMLPDPGRAVMGRNATRRRRVLLIEDTIPYRHLGSGFVRAADVVASLVELDYEVTVFPMNPVDLPANPREGFDERVELLWNHDITHAARFFAERAEYYDHVWVCRAHNLHRLTGVLDRDGWGPIARAHVVLDTEALACNREAAQARLEGRDFDSGRALKREMRLAHLVQDVVSVSAREQAQLQKLKLPRVHVLGHAMTPKPTPNGFAERHDILALGALYAAETPNVDGLVWFIAKVWPLVRHQIRQAKLHIAGFVKPDFDAASLLAGPGVVLHGFVADPAGLYDKSRIFLAPTRFAAGIPFKVHEAAACGVPVMTTDLIAGQLGWQSGRDLMAASADDPEAFAGALVALHGDQALWTTLRDNALARIAQECSPARFTATIPSILAAR